MTNNSTQKQNLLSLSKLLYVAIILVLLITINGCGNAKVEDSKQNQEIKLFKYTSRYEVQMEILGNDFYPAIQTYIKEHYPKGTINGILLHEKNRTEKEERRLIVLEKDILEPLKRQSGDESDDDFFEIRLKDLKATGLARYKKMLNSSLGDNVFVSVDLSLEKKQKVIILIVQRFQKEDKSNYWKAELSTQEMLEQSNKPNKQIDENTSEETK